MKYFPFTSERKASSVVVRDEQNRLFAFVKGADSSVRKMFDPLNDSLEYIEKEVENYAA